MIVLDMKTLGQKMKEESQAVDTLEECVILSFDSNGILVI